MSSTDDERIARFFDEILAPAARRCRAPLLDAGKSGSSWQSPPGDVPDLGELSPDSLGEALQARLVAEGFPELAELVPELMRLAEALRPSGQVDDEVDPFVYVMH